MPPDTGHGDISFDRLLRHASGHKDPGVDAALAGSEELRALSDNLQRMVTISRRAPSSPSHTWLQRRLLEDDGTPIPPPPTLGLSFDSWKGVALAAAPLRATATRDVRFLRYEGEFSVELQVRTADGQSEVRGQITPTHAATWGVLIPEGRLEREFAVEQDGTFVVRDIPTEGAELDFGTARITDLSLSTEHDEI